MSFNPGEEKDPTYQRFMLNLPDDSITVEVYYYDNRYLQETLLKEMEYCKRVDYEAYEHIWPGKPKTISEAVILKRRYKFEAFTDCLWQQADRQFFRVRLRPEHAYPRVYTLHPVYIEYEAYGVGVELDEMAQL